MNHFTRMRWNLYTYSIYTSQVKWKIFLREKQTLNSYDVYLHFYPHYIYTHAIQFSIDIIITINIIYLAQPVEINKLSLCRK